MSETLLDNKRNSFFTMKLLSLLIVTACLVNYSKGLEAKINMDGVTSTIAIAQTSTTLTLTVPGDIRSASNAPANIKAVIKAVPVLYIEGKQSCSVENLGPDTDIVLESSAIGGDTVEIQNPNNLKFDGYSMVLVNSDDNDPWICGNILQTSGNYYSAMAFFHGEVYGRIYFRQHESTPSSATVYADFSEMSSTENKWLLSSDLTSCEQLVGSTRDINVFNPNSISGTSCTTESQQSCRIGDFSGKLGDLEMGKKSGKMDSNINLSGEKTIINKFLIIFDSANSNKIAGCAQVVVTQRSAEAFFNDDGVSGKILFSQVSPFDPVSVSVDLQGLNSEAGGYHVHKYPTISSNEYSNSLCSGTMVSGHFNPFNIVVTSPSYPTAASTSVDKYETGDLSGKFGLLTGNDVTANYEDQNLSLFGKYSILGRSIVIHKADGSRWVCTNIVLDQDFVSAVAYFKKTVIGQVVFTQEANKPRSDNWMFITLDFIDSRAGTIGNSLTIHTGKPSDCTGSNPIFNPDGRASGCSELSDCPLGDVSEKTRTSLNIRTTTAEDYSSKHVLVDEILPLSGSNSIIGKTAILKASGGAVVACALIQPLEGKKLKASLPKGSVTFSQPPGLIAFPTNIKHDFSSGYSIAVFKLPPEESGMCSSLSDELWMKEITDGSDIKTKYLPLSGRFSILDRSLVLIKSGKRVECSTVKTVSSNFDKTVRAVITFSGTVSGKITFAQDLYKDGTASDTAVIVDKLSSSEEQGSTKHNWHVHEFAVYFDNTAVTDKCSSTGGHFDPYDALSTDKTNYGLECKPENPLRCELGDQANKLNTVDMVEDRFFYTDVDLPLYGEMSVLGKSVVIHVKDKGAARFDCADIIPITSNPVQVRFKTRPADEKFKTKFVEVLTDALNVDSHSIVVEWIKSKSGDTDVRLHFVGLDSVSVRGKFGTFSKSDKVKDLKEYAFEVIETKSSAESSQLCGLLYAATFSIIIRTVLFK